MIDIFDEEPANGLDLDRLLPAWGGCISMICWCGIGVEDDNEKKWDVLTIIWLALCDIGICSSQRVCYTSDESCTFELEDAGVFHRPGMCNESVRRCLFVNRDKLQCTIAKIAWWYALNRTLFEGEDLCWCLSKIIPGMIHETDNNNEVMLYSRAIYSHFIDSQWGDFPLL